jgi:uncharacterized protein Yka (UPF0111/DUF47 family)
LSDSGPPSRVPIREGVKRRWRRILLAQAPDVLALLVAQGNVTVTGLAAFDAWSHGGGQDAAVAVRAAQHEAYAARRELLGALRAALSTPVDQEDLYVLSERVDRILGVARNAVREAEVLGWAPDDHAARMGKRLSDATRDLVAGFDLFQKNPDEAGRRADAASDAVHELEREYREAMAGLLAVEDIRAVLAAQNVYRRYLRVGDAIVALADRLWYVVLRGA